jgi:hypothetical protein
MQEGEMLNPFTRNQVMLVLFYVSVFLMMFFLTSHQLSANYKSGLDLLSHIFFVEKIFDGEVYIPHPLWHLSVHYMKYITLNEKCAASLVSVGYVVLWVYIVQNVYTFLIGKERNTSYTVLFLSIIFIIGPAYIHSFSKYIVTGTGSPNIWHNITLFAVKPFALLTLFFTVLGLEKKKLSYYVIGFISLFLSIFAKPSFVIVFLPALALFILVKKTYSKENLLYFMILSLMSVSVLGYQFTHTYGGEGNGAIIIDVLGVWSRYSPNVLVSIILALMFPLVYSITNIKHVLRNNYIILTWFITFISIIYAAVFAESGPRYNHGNFFWSYMISLSLLYVFTIADYFKHHGSINRVVKIGLNLILVWQILVGVYYFVQIMEGHDAAGLFVMPKFF